MEEQKISQEMAEEEFNRFATVARLDLEKPRDESDRSDVLTMRDLFIYHVKKGNITVDDEGWPTIRTQSDDLPQIVFHNRPKVTALRAMDKCKRDNNNAKFLSMMGDALGIAPVRLNSLDYADFETVSLVFNLFLV
jgi:hypothetical protein